VTTSATTDKQTDHQCRHCGKTFRRESSLAVHLCEPKRRQQEQNEVGVQIGLQAYLRFYELTQGSARLKTFDDFASSAYYRAFVRFGRYCVAIRAINVPRFVEWVIRQNKKIDHWCRDSIYTEYLMQYLRTENVSDALVRAMKTAIDWSESTGNPDRDYLRFGNDNTVCYAVTTGRVSAWVLYNCDSGQEFLARLNPEQISMIWPMIDADVWQRRFSDYAADTEYAKELLRKAGW
jgi:hypothetical protein